MKKSLQLTFCWLCFYSASAQQEILLNRNIASALSPAGITRAGSNIDVIYHRCYWRINPDSASKGIKGSVMTSFMTTANNVTSISFDMHSVLVVDSVRFHNTRLSTSNITRSGHVVNISFGTSLAKGLTDSLTIYYHGTPPNPAGASIGYVKASTTAAGNFIYTVSQPFEDKDWWPCKSDMTDKIDSMDIYINTPAAFKAASNGALISSVTSGSSITYFWKHRYAIPSYLVCIGVAKYVQLNSGTVSIGGVNMPVFHYVFPRSSYTSLQSTLDLCKPMLTSFSALLGDYPYKKEKYGHYEHQSTAGGMEHATFSGMSAAALSDWKIIAHELGHQWFGDKVTCASWGHIWLNEGFAQYMETVAAEVVPSLNSNLPSIRASIKNGARSITNLSPFLTNVSNTDDIFGSSTGRYYQRGAVIVSMLRALLGDQKFYQGLKNYLEDPLLAYNAAETDDLRRHMELVSGLNLERFFTDWVYGTGNPNYSIQWVNMGKRIDIAVKQTRSGGASVAYFQMPVVLRISGGVKDTTVVLFDQDGVLSYAGGSFAASPDPAKIGFNLSFVPTAVSFDPENVTMATGSAGLFLALAETIQDFTVVKKTHSNAATIYLSKHAVFQQLVLEKSINGINFFEAGNMSLMQEGEFQVFALDDVRPLAQKTYYRVKLVGLGGNIIYSNTKSIDDNSSFRLSVSPNPAKDKLAITGWNNNSSEPVHVMIVNMQGSVVMSQKENIKNNSITLDVSRLPAGLYIIRATSSSDEVLLHEKLLVNGIAL